MTEFWETRHRNWLDQYISFKISYFYMYPMKSLSWEENETLIKESEWRVKNRVNALNPRSVLNTGNRAQGGHHCVVRPMGSKQPIRMYWGQRPHSSPLLWKRGLFPVYITLPEFSAFTLSEWMREFRRYFEILN